MENIGYKYSILPHLDAPGKYCCVLQKSEIIIDEQLVTTIQQPQVKIVAPRSNLKKI